MIRTRGIIDKPRRGRGLVRMCWYCGTGTWNGDLVTQADGSLLHEGCQHQAEGEYPDRAIYDGEQVDAKVAWRDQRGDEDDVGAFWA